MGFDIENIIEAVEPTLFGEVLVIGRHNATFDLSLRYQNWNGWKYLTYKSHIPPQLGIPLPEGFSYEMCLIPLSVKKDISVKVLGGGVYKIYYIDLNNVAHEQPF